MAIKIKICGTTTIADGLLVQEASADFVGVILEHAPSPRCISREQAAVIAAALQLPWVAVTVNREVAWLLEANKAIAPTIWQLHGDEPPATVQALARRGLRVWKVLAGVGDAVLQQADLYRQAGAEAILLDARETLPQGTIYGGTGKQSDWATARRLVSAGHRLVLAGGLTAENVARAIAEVEPWALDVVSGVEAAKGTKDPKLLHRFMEHARQNGLKAA